MKNLLLSAALAVFTFSGQAQTLSLEEALNLATNSSHQIKGKEFNQKHLAAKTAETDASRRPSLKYTGSYNRLSYVTPSKFSLPVGTDASGNPIVREFALNPYIPNQFTNRLMLSQPIFVGGRLKLGLEASKLNEKIAQQEYDRSKADVILSTKTAFWNLYKAQQFQKLVTESVNQMQAHLTDVQNLLKMGVVTQNDLLRSQLQLSNARMQQIEANNAVQLATAALNQLLGNSLDKNITLNASPRQQVISLEPVNTLTEKALQNRPEVKVAELQEKTGEIGVKSAKAGWLPQVSAAAVADYNNPNQRIIPAQDKFHATWAVGLNVSMDIWNWNTTKHQTEQARMMQMQAKEGLSLTKEMISLEITQLYLSAAQAQEKIKLASETVEQAKENHRIVTERYKKGAALNSDVIDANTAWLSSNINLTASQVEYELVVAKLEKAVGQAF
jgi:outer membrane protein TolC